MALRSVTRRPLSLCALGVLVSAAACAEPFDTTRSPAKRGTVGQELFGVVCDRLGAQSLQEDLTGASFHGICHPDANGNYASTVDQTQLPAANPDAKDVNGNPVTVAVQNANRAADVTRVEALARRRADLIGSFDAIFPAVNVPVVDLNNSDPTKSCTPNGTAALNDQLSDLLGRLLPLYNDGTIPQSTESLATIFNSIKASPEAQDAFARFEARQGYRPLQVSLGVARPSIAYPHLRDFTNTALSLLSSDSQPYNNSKLDSNGNRIPIPGPANDKLNQMVAVAHNELLYATQDAAQPALAITADPSFSASQGRNVLNRPRGDLEMLQALFYKEDAAFGLGGAPRFIALRDPRGYAQVHGPITAPFVDADGDGLADVDTLGQFVTSDQSIAPSPFFAIGATGSSFDQCGRAVRASGSGGSVDGGGADAGTAGDDSACGTTAGARYYDYINTSNVFAASLMRNLKTLANPDPTARHETLMYALAGAPLLFGARDGSPKSSKCYAPDPANPSNCKDPASLLQYDAFETDQSALVDLVYALGQMLGDPTMVDTTSFAKSLVVDQLPSVARLIGDALSMKAQADQHSEAKIPAASTFWDEMLDVTVELEKEPGLLEDVLKALGDDRTQKLGQIFANYMSYDDKITYKWDPSASFASNSAQILSDLNSPPANLTLGGTTPMGNPVDRSQADTGFNRSAMFRFLSLIHDTNGVTACNKEGAKVHAKGLPVFGSADVCGTDSGNGALCDVPILNAGARPFHECEVFKIENLAKFYLDSMVGKASIYFRPTILRKGLCIGTLCVGAATVGIIEQSSGLGYTADTSQQEAVNDTYGFWDPISAGSFRPRPQWLDRLVFFDQANNTNNTLTQPFLADLQGANMGSQVCPERVIADPCNNVSGCGSNSDANVSADGKVHGLRSCQDGDWLPQRGADTIFVWEQFGFFDAITPLLSAFANHGREDLFLDLMETLYRHWGDAKVSADECKLTADTTAKYQQCTHDGVVSYEPLLAQMFSGDILTALHDLEPILEKETIQSCTAADPKTGLCTAAKTLNGITVLANATRALVDPAQAQAAKLTDRHGAVTAQRNDGSTNPQVTPIYLLTGALNAMDNAFNATTNPNPSDDRFAQWRLARSQLVDQFLKVDGTALNSTFDNAAVPKILPTLLDLVRDQLVAHCPNTFSPSSPSAFASCDWARKDLTNELVTTMHGPTFAATMDLMEALRTDAPSRAQLGQLLEYLLDAASDNDALANLLASANDLLQLLKDDTNLVPLYHALGPALEPTTRDAQGNILKKSVIDAQLSLLGRMSGRALDANGKEICSAELDPNQVLTFALKNLVTPMTGSNGQLGQAPLQTIMDVIGDVNRADPSIQTKFEGKDYANIADEVSSFLLDKQRGLEQFYAIVKNGTVK